MKIWIIADTHFRHDKIKEMEGRPEDFNEQIIKNWNDRVADDDLVIHLGDVIFGTEKGENLPKLMSQLKGKKVLARGNHDKYPGSKWGDWDWFMERGFDFVCDYFIYNNMAFSHAPLTPLPHKGIRYQNEEVELNIHGHFHRGHTRLPKDEVEAREFQDEFYDYKYYAQNKDKYKLIQIEDELRPFSLEEVLAR